MDAEKYLEERLEDRIDWYEKMSETNHRWYKRLRVVEVVGAAFLPLFAGYVFVFGAAAVVLGVLGILVAVTAGVLGLYQFQQKCVACRAVSEALRREKYLYLTRSAPYSKGDEASLLRFLVQRAEGLISEEEGRWMQDEFAPKLEPRAKRKKHGTDPIHAPAMAE